MAEQENKQTLLMKLLDLAIGPSKRSVPVIKRLQEEEQIAIEFLYPVEQDDAHGERIDAAEAQNLVDEINKAIERKSMKMALNHVVALSGCEVVKAWINEKTCLIGDTLVPEGWPVCEVKFHSEELWKMRKDGSLMGLSIGCKGNREETE